MMPIIQLSVDQHAHVAGAASSDKIGAILKIGIASEAFPIYMGPRG